MKRKNSWWAKTFDEAYFSLWDPSDPGSQSWSKKELKLIDGLGLKKNAKILDIPCGQGRHVVELALRGFRATGVDYSSVALEVARKYANKSKTTPIFLKQDMRFLKIKERFDAVLTLGNSFGYFSGDDNEKVIRNISRLLKPSGFFVMHQLNPIGALRQFGKDNGFKIPGGYVKFEDISFDPIHSIKDSRWVIIRNNKKKILDIKLRLYTFPEISYLFARYKLNIVSVYGSFDKKPYQFNSPSMIIIARKIR